jgi:hypothetical protein
LFLLSVYINDISVNFTNGVRLFADDTSLYVIVDNNIVQAANSLTNDLEKIKQWSTKWAVNFNPQKTINLNITRKHIFHPKVNFGCNGPDVMNTESRTHLGLKFQSDGTCSWK